MVFALVERGTVSQLRRIAASHLSQCLISCAIPSWQTGFTATQYSYSAGTGTTSVIFGRGYPDFSAPGDPNTGYLFYLNGSLSGATAGTSAAAPVLAGFFAKILIFLNLLELKQFLGAVFLMLLNIISVYYYIRVIKITFFEISFLKTSNLEFQMIYTSNFYETRLFIIVFLLFSLVFIFFYPLSLFLFAQYSILMLQN
jgi:hypothetical protein